MQIFTTVIFLAAFLAIASAQNAPLKVRFHVFVHDDVAEKYRTSVLVPEESTIYDALMEASEESAFSFEPVDGPKIIKIGSNEENEEDEEYWYFYVLNTAPTRQNLPDPEEVVSQGTMLETLQSMDVENEMHYLFWLRH